MDIFKRFKTSEDKEINGVEVSLGEGAFITVARAGNEAARNEMERLNNLYREQLGSPDSKIREDTQLKIAIEVMSKHILKDWRGFKMYGKDLPYTLQDCEMVLTALKDFRELVQNVAMRMDLYLELDAGDAAKN